MSTLLAQARLQACRYWPFASHAILSMVPVARPGLGTLAVDRHWRLYYDESALQQIGKDQAAGIILHELDHLLKRHHKRGKSLVGDDGSKWETWNYATDASINSDLRAQGIPLPETVIYPQKFDLPDGLSAEEYFRKLSEQGPEQQTDTDADDESADNTDQQPSNQGDHNEDGNETTNDSQSDEATSDHTGSPTDPEGTNDQGDEGSSTGTDPSPVESGGETSDEAGETGACPNLTPGQSGSCSDGQQRPWELPAPDDDNPGLDDADQEQLIHVTASNVLEKECGKGAGGHRQWAEDALNPPVDPAAKLLNLVRRYCDVTVGIGERSFRRPSRRNANPQLALPSNVAPLPRITVIVDTSGSMDAEDLGLALGMIRKVLNTFRIRDGIKVITGGTTGQTHQLCLSDPRSIELAGGGGTNMSVIIAQALDEQPKPQMVLVCTDGWTPWPKENPGVPIVACLSSRVTELPDLYEPPNWMTVVELKL